jgi:hypothetical protein
MSTSVGDILSTRRSDEPPEIAVIKQFVREHYDAPCQVILRSDQIIIQVQSAGLAGSLRMKLHKLQNQLDTTRRLSIRIT